MSPINVLRATRANLLPRSVRGRRTIPLASFVASLLLALAALSLSVQRAQADATTYSSTKRQFKVGILLVDSTAYNYSTTPPTLLPGGPENPDPFVFYIADTRTDVKPQNWELINPLAPTQVTADIKARWDVRDPADLLNLGQTVTKNMAPYWEVSLSKTPLSDLLQYDLLFITNHRLVSLTPQDREKLRKLVDAGGIVWIEDCGNMRIDAVQPFFLDQLQFAGGNQTGNAQPFIYQPTHPILNTPYHLSFEEIANLGDKNYGDYHMVSLSNANAAPNPETLVDIVGNTATKDSVGNAMPYIAAGNYGSGAVIATSGDSGCDINDYAGGYNSGSGGNSGVYCGPNIVTAHLEDLKFVYNLINWGSANNTFRRNSRRSADSFENVGAPLINSFSVTAQTTSAITNTTGFLNSVAAPLTINGLVFETGIATGGSGSGFQLRAYDADPQSDLDGDGNSDDGIPDLSRGASFDEVWQTAIPGNTNGIAPSAPVYAVVGNGTTPAILVTAPDGSLLTYRINPASPTTLPVLITNPASPTGQANYQPAASGLGSPDNLAAPAPVYFENKVFVAQTDGSIRCVDPVGGATLWQSFIGPVKDAQGNALVLTPSGSPTVGYVVQQGSSATAVSSNGATNDLMLYEPVQENGAGGDVLTYWLGTRNEVIKSNPANAGQFQTRASPTVGNTGATGAQQRWRVANGDGSASPVANPLFLIPKVRVYSPTFDPADNTTVLQTAEDNYAKGIVSPYLKVQSQGGPYNTGLTVNGTVTVVNNDGSTITNQAVLQDLLISVDYDVYYNDLAAGVSGNPQGLNGSTGARDKGKFFAAPAALAGYSTMSLSADDLLIGGYTEPTRSSGATTGAGATTRLIASIFASNEQDGSNQSHQKLRMTLHPGYTATVGTLTISEVPAIRNRIVFDPLWPSGNNTSAFVPGTNSLTPNNAEAITNLVPIGAPVTTNDGISYVLAAGTSAANTTFNGTLPILGGTATANVTVLLAFRTNADVSLTLPEAFDKNKNIQIQQVNALDDTAYSGGTGSPQIVSITVNTNANNNATNNPYVNTDPDHGRITITNFQDAANGVSNLSATQSFVVTYTPLGATATKTVVLPPNASPTTNPTQTTTELASTTARSASSGFTPILFYYILPGIPESGPTLSGSYIYFNQLRAGANHLIGVDANPAATDPLVRVGSGEQVLGVYNDPNNTSIQNHVRWDYELLPGQAPAPPVAGGGVVSVSTMGGLEVFENSVTLVADSRRILEVDGGGAAVWAVDAPIIKNTIGGALPITTTNGTTVVNSVTATGRTSLQRVPFAHPSVARRIMGGDYLIADTGNNRVLRMDRSGTVTWSLNQMNDPFGILAAGDPVVLNSPSDVQFYTANTYADPTNPASTVIGYEVHYVIADSGNFRILDIADYYDTNGKLRSDLKKDGTIGNGGNLSGEHVVTFSTRTGSTQGRSLQYQSIQRIAPVFNGAQQSPVLVGVVGNVAVTGPNTADTSDFHGGSLVQIAYHPYRVPDSANPANIWANLTAEPAGNGTIALAFNDFDISVGGNIHAQRITRPTFFQEVTILDTTVTPAVYRNYYLLCDASGVYTLTLGTTNRLQAIFGFTQTDYAAMFPNRLNILPANIPPGLIPTFVPTSVQRLSNGDYLISNGYAGDNANFVNGRFVGEVFQVKPNAFNGTNTAFGGAYDGFSAPSIVQVAVPPGSPQKFQQVMGTAQSTENTGLMEQPRSASRQ